MSQQRWDSRTTARFMEEYSKHECLWDIRSDDYSNKTARDKAATDIIKSMNLKNMNINDIKNKIRVVRNTYINEKKKIKMRKEAGEKYVVRMSWFSTADKFLSKVVNKKRYKLPKTDIDLRDPIGMIQSPNEEVEEEPNVIFCQPSLSNTDILENDPLTDHRSEQNRLTDPLTCSEIHNAKSSIFRSSTSSFGIDVENNLPPSNEDPDEKICPRYNDEHDTFGALVASHMRALPTENSIRLQGVIHNLLIDERIKTMNIKKEHVE